MLLSNPPDRTPAQYPAAKILTGSLTHTHVVICTVVESHGSLLCGMRFLGDAFIPTRTQVSERVRVSVCKCGLSINKNHYCYPKATDTGRRAPLSSNLSLYCRALVFHLGSPLSALYPLFISFSPPFPPFLSAS